MAKRPFNSAEKFRYSFDNFMSKGGLSVFSALIICFVAAIVLMAVLRYLANLILPQESMASLTNQWWLAFLQIADGGSIAEDTASNAANRVVGIISLFLGMVLFSSLVAFITSQFEEMLTRMRKGESRVIETGHSLILGFGDRVLEIIRELIVANESQKRAAVVVLSAREKDEMDDFFRNRVESTGTTRIITRSGSTSSIQLLQRVGVAGARSIIILNDAAVDASHDEKELADARVIKTILAVLSCTGGKVLPPVVAELHLKSKQELACNISPQISIIDEHSILARLMVQTSRVSGLAQVYDKLVGFEGNEFYFYAPLGGWKSKTYADIVFHFPSCCVLGVRRPDGTVIVNPPTATVLADGDEAILLAEDDSAIVFSRQKVPSRTPSVPPGRPLERPVEKQLIIGWRQKTAAIIDEYSKYLFEGSGIDLVVEEPDETMKAEFNRIQTKYPSVKMRLLKAEINNPDVLPRLKPEQYDNVIILSADGGDAELRDSDTIAKLLQFRLYFKKFGPADVRTQLITEVADSENIEVIQSTGVKDFLISNRFVSKIYAQVSEEQGVLAVYENLFNEAGSEVYLKPLDLFLPSLPVRASFADLCAAALARNETCFGVRLLAEEEDAARNHGIHLNPPKHAVFELKPGDQLITLAENET